MWRTASKVGLVLAVAMLASVSVAYAKPLRTGFSGYELSAGGPCPPGTPGTTCGTSFGGWTNGPNGHWSLLPGHGGSWAATINYSGTPGIGSAVTLTGGSWSWNPRSGPPHAGAILTGQVTWPSSLSTSIDRCGPGVATINAVIAEGTSTTPGGSITGCLDDTHLSTVFPPHIWGTLTLGSP
jgi:hypothetical protein